MQTIINSQLPEFSVQAFQNGQFKTVTDKEVNGESSSSIRPTSLLFVRPNWSIWLKSTNNFRPWVWRSTL